MVPRRAGVSTAEQRRSCCGASGEQRKQWRRQSACRRVERQQGIVHFKLASARRGQAKSSAWRPHGGNLLATVGHERSGQNGHQA